MMPYRALLFSLLLLCLTTPSPAQASSSDLGIIIENFVVRHFPEATSHVWIVNGTQWDGDEMVVDVQTIVTEKQVPTPIENRYLLLIKEGILAAAQRVPLDDATECQKDET